MAAGGVSVAGEVPVAAVSVGAALAVAGVSAKRCSDSVRDFVSPRRQMQKMLMAATVVMMTESGIVEGEPVELMIAAKRTGEMPAPMPAI